MLAKEKTRQGDFLFQLELIPKITYKKHKNTKLSNSHPN